MIRVEVRCESPPDLPQRSGAIVLDLHEIEVEIRDAPPNLTPSKKARFGGPNGKTLKDVATMSWQSGLVAHNGPTGKHINPPFLYVYSPKSRKQSKGIFLDWASASGGQRKTTAYTSSTVSTFERIHYTRAEDDNTGSSHSICSSRYWKACSRHPTTVGRRHHAMDGEGVWRRWGTRRQQGR